MKITITKLANLGNDEHRRVTIEVEVDKVAPSDVIQDLSDAVDFLASRPDLVAEKEVVISPRLLELKRKLHDTMMFLDKLNAETHE